MRVNEIFYSLQGEGRFTGTPAVFVRFSGCNLRCWFCDTDHSASVEMSAEDILEQVRKYPTKHIVLTGGEPSLQVDAELTGLLHREGFFIQMETNGTIALKEGVEIDWITCSPKGDHEVRLAHVDELKVVMDAVDMDVESYCRIQAREYRLQPCDVKDPEKNRELMQATLDHILAHPHWRFSLQTHKMIDIR